MMTQNKKEWLENLAVGDTVVIVPRGIGHHNTLGTVARRTPSGRIYLEGSTDVYNPNGSKRGVRDSYYSSYLEEPTPSRLNSIKQAKLVKVVSRLVMNKIEWHDLSVEELEQAIIALRPLNKSGEEL